MSLQLPNVRLVRATVPLLTALTDDPAAFAAQMRSPIPAGWPEFPEAVPHTLDYLSEPGRADDPWMMHFFVDADTSALVGSGGYTGPPADRGVEIGYEIAPAFRRRGFARAAARALIEQAFATDAVDRIIAHTLAETNASNRALRALGFEFARAIRDPDEGEIWAWSLSRAYDQRIAT